MLRHGWQGNGHQTACCRVYLLLGKRPVPRLFLKDLIKGLAIFCGGIIPVLGASGLPDPPVWLEMAPKQGVAGVQAIAGFTSDQQLLLHNVVINFVVC